MLNQFLYFIEAYSNLTIMSFGIRNLPDNLEDMLTMYGFEDTNSLTSVEISQHRNSENDNTLQDLTNVS